MEIFGRKFNRTEVRAGIYFIIFGMCLWDPYQAAGCGMILALMDFVEG